MKLYVYYRVAVMDAARAQAAFERVRAGAPIELLRRPEESGRLQTWMEVYGPGELGLEPPIAQAMAQWIVGERHREVFEPLA